MEGYAAPVDAGMGQYKIKLCGGKKNQIVFNTKD